MCKKFSSRWIIAVFSLVIGLASTRLHAANSSCAKATLVGGSDCSSLKVKFDFWDCNESVSDPIAKIVDCSAKHAKAEIKTKKTVYSVTLKGIEWEPGKVYWTIRGEVKEKSRKDSNSSKKKNDQRSLAAEEPLAAPAELAESKSSQNQNPPQEKGVDSPGHRSSGAVLVIPPAGPSQSSSVSGEGNQSKPVAALPPAPGSPVLLDKDNWKVALNGFAETDMIIDTTRSLAEAPGNIGLDRPGTYNGDKGRTQFSIRNSRLGLGVSAPQVEGWKTKGYFEVDFLGYDPAPAATSQSEGSFFTNPAIRARHIFLTAEKDGWLLLAGQTWQLFGWQPNYFPCPVSIMGIPAITFARNPQFLTMKNWKFDENTLFQAAFAVSRPVQRDSEIPNLDAGLRFAFGSRKSGSVIGAAMDAKSQSTSIAVSGTVRAFEITPKGGQSFDQIVYVGNAFAINTLIPIIASSDGKDVGNTLTLTGSFTQGSGYGDQFLNWSGGIGYSAAGTAPPTVTPSLDAGLAGYDGAGGFHLINLQTYNLQLQYFFPMEWKTFISLGYSQIWSDNIYVLSGAKYYKDEFSFIDAFYNLTKQLRVGLEYSIFQTHFVDTMNALNRRLQLAFYFMF